MAHLKTLSIEIRLFLLRRRSSFHSAEVLAALDEMTMFASTKQFGDRYFEEDAPGNFTIALTLICPVQMHWFMKKMHNLPDIHPSPTSSIKDLADSTHDSLQFETTHFHPSKGCTMQSEHF